MDRPTSFVFEVTQSCNHACLHCYNVWKNAAPYPPGQLPTAETLELTLLDIRVTLGTTPPGAPVGPSTGPANWASEEGIRFRTDVIGPANAPLGFVEASFNLERLRDLILGYRKGFEGQAVLFTAEGRVLAAAEGVHAPPQGTSRTAGKKMVTRQL